MAANRSRFSLSIQGASGISDAGSDARVTGFSGHAGISGLFQYDITIASKHPDPDLKSWLDRPATLVLHGEPDQYIHGLVMEASQGAQGLAATDNGQFTGYRLRIVPRLWRLTQSKNHRIFQDKNANQIVAAVLGQHGIRGNDVEDCTQPGAVRGYCVQYGETDFNFVARLLAEEGWHFHFRHRADRHTLILADSAQAFTSKPGPERLRYEQETSRPQDTECIHQLDYRQQLTPGAVRLGDFNFAKPTLGLRETSGGTHHLELFHHPGGFEDPATGKRLAELRQQQTASSAQWIRMQTHATTCAPGQRFTLHSHPTPAFNQQYLIVAVSSVGTQPQALGESAGAAPSRCLSTLECIPASTPFRPAFDFRKPTVKGPVTAIVTGPTGDEIYTDSHGRVKVQFFWDRAGQADQNTSCWLRVRQPVAGVEWGGIALPRTGQEVLVEFEHGDPDRPLVTGRLYNGQNPPPYSLPQHKSRSVLKTLSSPGGGGYHEIRVDDRKGAEQLFIRAEKDLDLRVKQTHKTEIGHNRHRTVGQHDRREFKQELHETVQGALNEKSGQQMALTVGQDLHLRVTGARVVQAGNAIHIKAGSKAVLQGGTGLSIKGGAGFITLDASGVAITGPLVRINEGIGGTAAQRASPALPGVPAEADNGIPGAKLRAAGAAGVAVPGAIPFDRSQMATLAQAAALGAPLAEDCEECKLAAQMQFMPPITSILNKLTKDSFALRWNLAQAIGLNAATGHILEQLPYEMRDSNGKLLATGKLDSKGLTNPVVTEKAQKINLYLGDGAWQMDKVIRHNTENE